MGGDKTDKKCRKRHYDEAYGNVSRTISLENVVSDNGIYKAFKHILGYGIAVEFDADTTKTSVTLSSDVNNCLQSYMKHRENGSELSKNLCSLLDKDNSKKNDSKTSISNIVGVKVSGEGVYENEFTIEVPGIGIVSSSVQILFMGLGKKGTSMHPPFHSGPCMFDGTYVAMDMYSSDMFETEFDKLMKISVGKAIIMLYNSAKPTPLIVTDGRKNYYQIVVSKFYKGSPIVSIFRPESPTLADDVCSYITKSASHSSVKKMSIVSWIDFWVYQDNNRKRFLPHSRLDAPITPKAGDEKPLKLADITPNTTTSSKQAGFNSGNKESTPKPKTTRTPTKVIDDTTTTKESSNTADESPSVPFTVITPSSNNNGDEGKNVAFKDEKSKKKRKHKKSKKNKSIEE